VGERSVGKWTFRRRFCGNGKLDLDSFRWEMSTCERW
jgi:hypothetical protein